MDFRYSDPALGASVLIPALLAVALAWGTGFAWRRGGASDAIARRASLAVGAATAAWMAATWLAARSGILRLWDRNPPPFGVLVLTIVALAALLAFGGVGRRLALFVPLWRSSPSRDSGCPSSSRCTRCTSGASCPSR
jgi:hypothetical protein